MAPRTKKAEQPKGLSLVEKVAKFFELDKVEKAAKAEKEPLGTEFKTLWPDKGKQEVGDYIVVRGVQDRSKLNEDKLIQRLKELGFKNCIKKKEIVDSEEVERMIFDGKLPSSLLESCMDVQYVQTVSVKKA
jgi:hypothetical protein